jgi:GT2 family glycosyltransferase
VCDNGSQDGSLGYIKAWANGHLDSLGLQASPARWFSFPPIIKPIAYRQYDRYEALAGGLADERGARLILIQTGSNLGFAGGNNVGLRYALTRNDFDYVWLLNNDTVSHPDALTAMIEKMKSQPRAGLCGSTVIFYHKPDTILAAGGGTYNKWFGTSRHLEENRIIRKMAYVSGASLLVSKSFLQDIGLISERYFLYFEELDWAVRARGEYELTYASRSIVYHKEGRSIGSSSKPQEKSFTADYYSMRGRILFTRKFYPRALPTVYLGLLVALFNRIRRRQPDRVKMLLNILFCNKNLDGVTQQGAQSG